MNKKRNEHIDPKQVKVNKTPQGGNKKQIELAIRQVEAAIESVDTPSSEREGLRRLLIQLKSQLK